MKTLFRTLFLVALFMLPLASLFAQPNPNPTGTPVPLDGGLGVLLAAGAAYGLKKMRENKSE
jgi:hypothetical protein